MAPSLLISTHFTSKSYGAQPLFTDISLQIFDNERLGLIGPNGAGKTTLFNLICGRYRPSSGNILFEDTDITNFKPDGIIKICWRDPRLFAIKIDL